MRPTPELWIKRQIWSRLMNDPRAMQLLDDSNVALSAIAANSYRDWDLGRRWFVIVRAVRR